MRLVLDVGHTSLAPLFHAELSVISWPKLRSQLLWKKTKMILPDGPDGVRRMDTQQNHLKRAKIVYSNGNCVFDCTLEEISDSCARLELGIMLELPDTFLLYVADTGNKRESEVVWKKGTALGVRFK